MRRLLVLTIVLIAALEPNARADDLYTVATCATNGPGQGWSVSGAGSSQNACPRPGITATAPNTDTGKLGGFKLVFTPPASTHVAGYRLWRTVRLQAPWNYSLFN